MPETAHILYLLRTMVEHFPSNPSVLVVDDDPRVVEVLRQALERDGFQVHDAGSAGEGYRLYLEGSFSVLMVDEALLAINGLRLIRLMRLLDRTTTIVLISGVADLPTAVSGLRAGADDYFSKPFKLWDLKDRISSSNSRRGAVARQARPREFPQDAGPSGWERLEGLPESIQAHLKRLRPIVENELLQAPGFFGDVGAQAMAAADSLSVRESDRRLLGQGAALLFLGFGGEDPTRIQVALQGPEELREAWQDFALAGAELLDHMGPQAAGCAELFRATADLAERRSPPQGPSQVMHLAQIIWLALVCTLGKGWNQNRPMDAAGLERLLRSTEGGEPFLDPAVTGAFLKKSG